VFARSMSRDMLGVDLSGFVVNTPMMTAADGVTLGRRLLGDGRNVERLQLSSRLSTRGFVSFNKVAELYSLN